jgi:hypothetical protein
MVKLLKKILILKLQRLKHNLFHKIYGGEEVPCGFQCCENKPNSQTKVKSTSMAKRQKLLKLFAPSSLFF